MKWIDPTELSIKPFHLLDKEWALLVGGVEKPNPMTVSWGGFGTIWNRPTVTVYVRPTRYTFSLLRREPSFTLNILPGKYREALTLCGTRSGAELDKWKATGLSRAASERIEVPRVGEAELSFECRVMATMAVDPSRFLDEALHGHYPERDSHTAFLGEVLGVWASERFLKQ